MTPDRIEWLETVLGATNQLIEDGADSQSRSEQLLVEEATALRDRLEIELADLRKRSV